MAGGEKTFFIPGFLFSKYEKLCKICDLARNPTASMETASTVSQRSSDIEGEFQGAFRGSSKIINTVCVTIVLHTSGYQRGCDLLGMCVRPWAWSQARLKGRSLADDNRKSSQAQSKLSSSLKNWGENEAEMCVMMKYGITFKQAVSN